MVSIDLLPSVLYENSVWLRRKDMYPSYRLLTERFNVSRVINWLISFKEKEHTYARARAPTEREWEGGGRERERDRQRDYAHTHRGRRERWWWCCWPGRTGPEPVELAPPERLCNWPLPSSSDVILTATINSNTDVVLTAMINSNSNVVLTATINSNSDVVLTATINSNSDVDIALTATVKSDPHKRITRGLLACWVTFLFWEGTAHNTAKWSRFVWLNYESESVHLETSA